MSIVLIDLPNFFNGLIAESKLTPELTKRYFLDWLDMGLLAGAVNSDGPLTIGTWIFYSNRAMGPGAARVSPEELAEFVKRQNRIPGVSAMDVGIPGSQSESFRFACFKCGEENATQTQSEKGIDSTLITHLFDTMDYWKTATIISQDADYCPSVRALRKKGKLVYGAGFLKRASESLITECFGYKDIGEEYLLDDFRLFSVFIKGGKLSQFYKAASKTRGVEIKSWISANPPGDGSAGRWFIMVSRDTMGEAYSKEKRDALMKKASDIQREFPFVLVTEEQRALLYAEMQIYLTRFQLECLNRARNRYIDFPIKGPGDRV